MKEEEFNKSLIGKRITGVRAMTQAELSAVGWEDYNADGFYPVITIEGGVLLYPSQDPEGNGPGTIFGQRPAFPMSVTKKSKREFFILDTRNKEEKP